MRQNKEIDNNICNICYNNNECNLKDVIDQLDHDILNCKKFLKDKY